MSAIRVIMFDFGQTLVHQRPGGQQLVPYEHVEAALTAIGEFTTPSGDPLHSCLVSDYEPVPPPLTPAEVAQYFASYLAILDQTGLRRFFEPVEQRVTLSIHAGATKPKRAVFEKAIERLGVDAKLANCLLITEHGDHVRSVRSTLKMSALQFHSEAWPTSDFSDWADAPMLIAQRIAPTHFANVEAAVRMQVAATQDAEVTSARPGSAADAIDLTATVWRPITVAGHASLRDVLVSFSVEGTARRDATGALRDVSLARPSDEQVAEATSFVRGLAARQEISGVEESRNARATHRVETDQHGNRRLVRARVFSAPPRR